jgi:hypothetical protein
MTKSQKIERLAGLSGEKNEDILSTFLDLAGERILRRAYPFRSDIQEVPAEYHSTQIDIALYLLNKRGAEGETSHSENGISRSYESATVPDSMLKHITPHASVLGGKSK